MSTSLKFMAPYRLRAMIVELVETDPRQTVLAERDVDWIIRRYFKTIRPRDKTLRLYERELEERDHDYAPRHLRHLPRADIRGHLAEHAEWLLAHMIARRHGLDNLVDVRRWIAFCKQARKDAVKAAKQGVVWGSGSSSQEQQAPEADGHCDLARRLARFGVTEVFWSNQLKIAQGKKPSKKAAREVPPEAALLPIDTDTVPNAIRYQYDSDFSEASTLDYSESDASSNPSPEPANLIPAFCYEPPQIPNGRFIWTCPGPTCAYQIDLLHLLPENFDALPVESSLDAVRVLSSKAWNITDAPVQRALLCMVSRHYEVDHLNGQAGVYVSESPKTKRSWGSAGGWRVRKVGDATQTRSRLGSKVGSSTLLKIEEGSGSQQLRRSTRMPCPRTNPE